MSKNLFEEDLGNSYTSVVVLQVPFSWTYFFLQSVVLGVKTGSGLETQEIEIVVFGQLLSSVWLSIVIFS